MEQYELIASTTFGVEAIVKRELIALGYEVTATTNGKVTFLSDAQGIARANLWLRTADRVLLKVGEFTAETFDELFDQTKELPWEKFIPVDGKFTVNGKSVKSKLFSISDCQAIVKKSIVEKLKSVHNVDWFEEDGASFGVLVSILNDVATISIDTSGIGLHKRGYRIRSVEAPLKETLAAALVLLSYWNKDRVLYDVFCGSGTIPIEAAMIGRNIAPGLKVDFACKYWPLIKKEYWEEEINKAKQAIDYDTKINIYASDLDEQAIEAAKTNAEAAGVSECITFAKSDFKAQYYEQEYGVLISNPPYGERLMDEFAIKQLYRTMGNIFNKLTTWSVYIITSFEGFENLFERKADRVRKLFNGNIPTRYYQYYGPRPPLMEYKSEDNE
ncbi:MAG: class I SAM-dependent RNA methyltransferase [Firmicutes bacterium]|nr:class I SAM-dependent RNA methyltransferase [Bacillota bacterium]